MHIIYKKAEIKLINKDRICFAELEREGYRENQIITAEQQIINGKESNRFLFGEHCVAFQNITCEKIKDIIEPEDDGREYCTTCGALVKTQTTKNP